jgi:hypothetical protein
VPIALFVAMGLRCLFFLRGVLSVGVVGVIAGPLPVALLAESVLLLSPDGTPIQHQLK